LSKSPQNENELSQTSRGAGYEAYHNSPSLRTATPPLFQLQAKKPLESKDENAEQKSAFSFQSKEFASNINIESNIDSKDSPIHSLNPGNLFQLKENKFRSGNDAEQRGVSTQEEEDDGRQVASVIQKNETEKESTATATGVSLGPSYPLNTDKKYGVVTPIIVHGTNLKDVLDSELVGTSIDHTGSMAQKPSAKSNNSGFMAADNIPDDRHSSSKRQALKYYDIHGGDGSYSRLQMDLYKIPKVSEDIMGMQNSGYRIKRTVKKEGDKVMGIVTKTAEAVNIGAYSSTPGKTAKKEAKVVLREEKQDAEKQG
jgi:hypothetical protein